MTQQYSQEINSTKRDNTQDCIRSLLKGQCKYPQDVYEYKGDAQNEKSKFSLPYGKIFSDLTPKF